jgi:hypothetical protein
MTGASAGRSGLWQQDIVHVDMAGMSWPQFMACSAAAGECFA